MPSSAIYKIKYDETRFQLMLTFVSGRIYVYDGVPRDVYDTFNESASKGQFFNRYIRDRYRHREVKVAS